jgi:hypothetical protein
MATRARSFAEAEARSKTSSNKLGPRFLNFVRDSLCEKQNHEAEGRVAEATEYLLRCQRLPKPVGIS